MKEHNILLEEKLSLLNEILENTKLQSDAIEVNEARLNRLLDAREKLIEKVNVIDEELKTQNYLENNNEIGKLNESLRLKLEEIIELENKNETKMKEKYKDIKEKIENINKGKKAMNATYYNQSQNVGGEGRYFDKSIGKKK